MDTLMRNELLAKRNEIINSNSNEEYIELDNTNFSTFVQSNNNSIENEMSDISSDSFEIETNQENKEICYNHSKNISWSNDFTTIKNKLTLINTNINDQFNQVNNNINKNNNNNNKCFYLLTILSVAGIIVINDVILLNFF